jgi:hypothetical protein
MLFYLDLLLLLTEGLFLQDGHFRKSEYMKASCFIIFKNYSFIHMCIHCLGHFSPLFPFPTLSPPSIQFQAGPVLPLSLILLKKRYKHNKEDKAFLLLELRIAIQKYS